MGTEKRPSRGILEVIATSNDTSMDTWPDSGWSISPSHGVGIVDIPSPGSAEDLVAEQSPAVDLLGEVLKTLAPEDFFEFVDDLITARKAEEKYETNGIEGTISYNEYRNKRLEPESSV